MYTGMRSDFEFNLQLQLTVTSIEKPVYKNVPYLKAAKP